MQTEEVFVWEDSEQRTSDGIYLELRRPTWSLFGSVDGIS